MKLLNIITKNMRFIQFTGAHHSLVLFKCLFNCFDW